MEGKKALEQVLSETPQTPIARRLSSLRKKVQKKQSEAEGKQAESVEIEQESLTLPEATKKKAIEEELEQAILLAEEAESPAPIVPQIVYEETEVDGEDAASIEEDKFILDAVMAAVPEPEPRERLERVLRRKGVVRSYTQMNPGQIFPLLVSIVKAELYIKTPDLPNVQQSESDMVMEIKESSPYVRIVPVMPGCLISPPELVVDVRAEKVDAEFRIAPQAQGDLREFARIQIWHDGVLKDELPIPCQIRTQTLTRLASYSSVMTSMSGAALETYGQNLPTLNPDAQGNVSIVAYLIHNALSLLTSSGLWLGLFFLLTAFVSYLWLRPKRGDIVEKFLTTDLH